MDTATFEQRLHHEEYSHNHEAECQHYRDMLDHTPIGIAEARLSTGLISYINPAQCRMLGYTREELIGMPLPQVFAEDPRFIAEALSICVKQGIWQGEIRYRRKDSSVFFAHLIANTVYYPDGTPKVAIGFMRDISAEKEQAEQLQLHRFTVEHAADAIGWYDLRGKVLYFNKAAFALYGYPPEALEQLTVQDIDPDFSLEMLGAFAERLKHEGSLLVERIHRHCDGSAIPVEVTNSYLAFNDHEYIAVVIRDIRERKRAEAEREALQQQIIAAQREALRELSSPLIPISDNVVIVPLIGTIDNMRAQQMMEILLEGVARHQAELVILDITGVPVVDTQVAQAFIQAAQAVRLLGAQVMITGIQPQIAQTLVHLGVDLSSIQTRGRLQDGIAAALIGGRGA